MEISLSTLPFDIIPQIIFYICGGISEETFDSSPPPVMLIVLQHVNKRFYRAITNPRSIFYRILANFRYLPSVTLQKRLIPMMREVCSKFGSISLLEWCERYLRVRLSEQWFYGAAEGNHVVLLNWLKHRRGGKEIITRIGKWRLPNRGVLRNDMLHECRSAVVTSGRFEVLEWAYKNIQCFAYRNMLEPALRRGNLEAVKYISDRINKRANPFTYSFSTLACAAMSGSVETLQYVLECSRRSLDSNDPSNVLALLRIAAQHPVAMLKMLVQKWGEAMLTPDRVSSIVLAACESGRVDVLQYIFATTSALPSASSLEAACRCCQLEVIRYLLLEKGLSVPNGKFLSYAVTFSFVKAPKRLRLLESLVNEFGIPKAVLANLVSAYYVHPFIRYDCLLEALRFFHISLEIKFSNECLRDMLIALVLTSSYQTLPAIQYLFEELHFDVSKPLNLRRIDANLVRKDVLLYLKEKGIELSEK